MAQEKYSAKSQLTTHKFLENSVSIRSNSISIAEQWRNLQTSLITVKKRHSYSNDRENGNNDSEIDTRKKFVDLGGKLKDELIIDGNCDKNSVIELYNKLYDALKSKEKRINEENGRLECKEKLINSKEEDIKAKEIDIKRRCQKVELREKKLNERSSMLAMKEKKVEEYRRVLELKEKNLFGRLECKEKLIEERLVAIKSKEIKFVELVELKEKEIEERCEGIKMREERALSELCKVVEWKLRRMNTGFDVMEMEGKRARDPDVGCANDGLGLEGKEVNVPCKDLEFMDTSNLSEGLRGKEINDSNEGLRLNGNEIEECGVGDHCKEEEKEVNKPCEDLEFMDTQVNIYGKSLVGDLRGKEINDANDRLRLKVKEVGECGVGDDCQEQSKEGKRVNEPCEDLTLMDTQVSECIEPQGVIEKQIREASDQLESKEKEASREALELRVKPINELTSQLETNEAPMSELETMQIGNNGKEAGECIGDVTQESKEMKETHVSDYTGDVESKQKPLSNCYQMVVVNNHACTRAIVRHTMPMNGKALQTYLNERADKHESIGEFINSMLRSSQNHQNPAKLVLDAIDGFYAPPSNQYDAVFEISVVRSSCLLLLEQLMNINPPISKCLKREAETVAFKWMSNMRVEGMSDVPLLGFLLLVGNYDLFASFPWTTLERLCEMVGQHKVPPQLRQRLCLPKRHNVTWSLTQSGSELPPSEAHGVVCSTVDSSDVMVCSDIHMLCKKMDARGLRSYVIRCVKEHNILHDKIFDALRFASDPTKLVLDISLSFFVTELDEEHNYAVKTTCIYLLEQLIKLSPSITPDVSDEARDFASVWNKRLFCTSSAPVNHYGFLHFLAAYKLAKDYEGKQLLSFFKASYFAAMLYPPQKNVDLCRALGVEDKIQDFVGFLINKKKHLEAVKCISLFKMECDFPPVPLLEAYMELLKQKLDKKLKSDSFRGKDVANIELSQICSALTNISSLKLPYMFPTDSISLRIKQLREEKKAQRLVAIPLRKRGTSPNGTPAEQSQKRPRIGV